MHEFRGLLRNRNDFFVSIQVVSFFSLELHLRETVGIIIGMLRSDGFQNTLPILYSMYNNNIPIYDIHKIRILLY